jgi:hypothetical protein
LPLLTTDTELGACWVQTSRMCEGELDGAVYVALVRARLKPATASATRSLFSTLFSILCGSHATGGGRTVLREASSENNLRSAGEITKAPGRRAVGNSDGGAADVPKPRSPAWLRRFRKSCALTYFQLALEFCAASSRFSLRNGWYVREATKGPSSWFWRGGKTSVTERGASRPCQARGRQVARAALYAGFLRLAARSHPESRVESRG